MSYLDVNTYHPKMGVMDFDPTTNLAALVHKMEYGVAGAAVTNISLVECQADGKWDEADASSGGATGDLGVMLHSKGSDLADTEKGYVITEGIIRNTAWAFTPRVKVYASATPGVITETPPAVSGDTRRCVGYSLDADAIKLDISNVWHTMEDVFFGAQSTMGTGDYAAKLCADAGAARRITFGIPGNAVDIVGVGIVIRPGATAATWDIDIDSDYGAIGEAMPGHTGTDHATTYDLTNTIATEIDVLPILSVLAAGDIVGIKVMNNHGTGGAFYLMGYRLRYYK